MAVSIRYTIGKRKFLSPGTNFKHILLEFFIDFTLKSSSDDRLVVSGENTRLQRKRSRVRFPHSANICVYEHVCLYWVWVFLSICMYLQKNVVCINSL
jgi:hypothetical protein